MTITFSTRALMPGGRSEAVAMGDTATGRVVVAAGITPASAGGPLSGTFIYNATADTWETASDSGLHAFGAFNGRSCAGAVAGGIAFVVGGYNGSSTLTPLTTVSGFNLATKAWGTYSPLPNNSGRWNHAVASWAGQLYVFGGQFNESGGLTPGCYRFNPASNTWAQIASLPTLATNLSAVALGGKVYIMRPGGAAMFVYDITSNTYTTAAALTYTGGSSRAPQMFTGPGEVYATTDAGVTSVFNVAAGTWSAAESWPLSRFSASVGQVGSRVFRVGGQSGADGTRVVEQGIVNTTPNAPLLTAPGNGEDLDLNAPNTFAWTFSDPDFEDAQSARRLRYRPIGAPSWTVLEAGLPTQSLVLPAGTFAAGSYEWQVQTADRIGVYGPYSPSGFFSAAVRPPGPSIVSPVNGSTIAAAQAEIVWSTSTQTAYQIRRVADNGGVPDPSTVYYDSGEVTLDFVRSQFLDFPTNSRTEHVQLRTKFDGLFSAWVSSRFLVSYTTPAVPTLALSLLRTVWLQDGTTVLVPASPGGTSDAFGLTIGQPAPSGGQPTVLSVNVFRRVGTSGDGIRIARGVDPSGLWPDRTPASGVDYAYRVESIAANGTTSTSPWISDAVNLTPGTPGTPVGEGSYADANYSTVFYN